MNNKGTDQTVRMLVCACVNHNPTKSGFLAAMPMYAKYLSCKLNIDSHWLYYLVYCFYLCPAEPRISDA